MFCFPVKYHKPGFGRRLYIYHIFYRKEVKSRMTEINLSKYGITGYH